MQEKNFFIYTNTAEETKSCAAFFAKAGRNGLIICLEGDLGVGKTTFTQGLAAALHCTTASSPTFNLMNVYEADIPIYHFDLYRLNNSDDLYEIGFYEYTEEDGQIVLIEWPDKFRDAMPEDNIYLKIKRLEGDKRKISINLHGQKYKNVYEELKHLCQSLQ